MLETPKDNEGREYRPRPQHQEPLYTEKIYNENKIFFMDLKENDRGRFVKITEDVRGRRDTIMVPVEAFDEFLEALNRVADYSEELGGESPETTEKEEAVS